MRLRCCGCFGLLVVLGVLLVGFVWFTSQSALPEDQRPEPRATATASVQLAKQVDDKVTSFKETARSQDARLVLTEEELNAKIAEQLLLQTDIVRVRNVRVRLTDGVAAVEGRLAAEGIEIPVRTELQLSVTPDGGVKVDVGKVDLGPAGAIPGLQSQVESALRDQIGGEVLHFGSLKVRQVTVERGRLVVVGREA